MSTTVIQALQQANQAALKQLKTDARTIAQQAKQLARLTGTAAKAKPAAKVNAKAAPAAKAGKGKVAAPTPKGKASAKAVVAAKGKAKQANNDFLL